MRGIWEQSDEAAMKHLEINLKVHLLDIALLRQNESIRF